MPEEVLIIRDEGRERRWELTASKAASRLSAGPSREPSPCSDPSPEPFASSPSILFRLTPPAAVACRGRAFSLGEMACLGFPALLVRMQSSSLWAMACFMGRWAALSGMLNCKAI